MLCQIVQSLESTGEMKEREEWWIFSLPACTKYILDGKETNRFPFPSALGNAKPVIEYFDGWKCDISGVRKWEDLPREAREYVMFIEKQIDCPITYVSVGPERDSIIIRK